jgi:hypothetical protein
MNQVALFDLSRGQGSRAAFRKTHPEGCTYSRFAPEPAHTYCARVFWSVVYLLARLLLGGLIGRHHDEQRTSRSSWLRHQLKVLAGMFTNRYNEERPYRGPALETPSDDVSHSRFSKSDATIQGRNRLGGLIHKCYLAAA